MARNLNNRLTKIQQCLAPPDPPTFQIVWPDKVGPIQPVPHGKWAGLLRIKVIYTDNWRDENKTH